MNPIGTAIVLVVFLATALAARRGDRTDLYLGGRRASTGTVAGSLLATCLGASATVGLVGRAYTLGWVAFWWLGTGCVGLLLLSRFWVGPMRSCPGIRSLPQWLETGYGRPARSLAAGIIAVMWTGVIAAQWVAAGALLRELVGLPLWAGVALAAGAVGFYTAWGGQMSVLRTDLVQAVLIGAAVLGAAWAALRLQTPAAALWPAPRDLLWSEAVPFSRWTALLLVVGGMYVVGPDMFSRVLAARTTAAARRGALIAAALLLPCAAALTFAGVRLRQAGIGPGDPRGALPFLLGGAGLLPPWAATAAMLGLLAAVFSSADTCLLTAATVLDLDIPWPNAEAGVRAESPRRLRVLVAVVAAGSALLAWRSPHIIGNLLLAYSFYAGGLLVPLLLLASRKASKAAPRPWVWGGMAAGGTVPVVLLVGGRVADYAVAGAVGSLVCAGVVLAGAIAARMIHLPNASK
ncbi:MAG: hypothetical protein GXP31_10215 [Kiritimatiellaeota bacterium]|nr:hypothetical protein [Kiritimatiellota bacterium]